MRSFALLCHDPDAPSGLFQHWAAYDIPREWTGLAEGHGPETLADGFRQAINDFGQRGRSRAPSAAGGAPEAELIGVYSR